MIESRSEGSVILEALLLGEFMKAHRIAQLASEFMSITHLQTTVTEMDDTVFHSLEACANDAPTH